MCGWVGKCNASAATAAAPPFRNYRGLSLGRSLPWIYPAVCVCVCVWGRTVPSCIHDFRRSARQDFVSVRPPTLLHTIYLRLCAVYIYIR